MSTHVAAIDLKAGQVVARGEHVFRVLEDAVEFRGMAEFPVVYDPPTDYCYFDVFTLPLATSMEVLDGAVSS